MKYQPRGSIKGQNLADFTDELYVKPETTNETRIIYVGASNIKGSGVDTV